MNNTGGSPCHAPFLPASNFGTTHGYVQGRMCAPMAEGIECCLPCPISDWVYSDNFHGVVDAVGWLSVVSTICVLILLLSWFSLPVEKTKRHYLSICYAIGVLFMSLGFVITLAAQPKQCYDAITPNDMKTSKVCGASASILILGGWCSVMWCFLRSLSLHLQICWQVAVGQGFCVFAQVVGWGIPLIGIILALVFSGVSFRWPATCHINHKNSLANLWIPLLVFAGLTLLLTFATFGYCVRVYLKSLGGVQTPSTADGSSLPTTSNGGGGGGSISPHQAYRRIRRVILLQWRGIALVLIMVVDVIFFSVVLVFQDQTLQDVLNHPEKAETWVTCLIMAGGDKTKCFDETGSLVVSEVTVGAVLGLLALNGIWILFFLGRWTMVTGWIELVKSFRKADQHGEFVSVDARLDVKQQQQKSRRSYEMLSRQSTGLPSPASPVKPNFQTNGQIVAIPESPEPQRQYQPFSSDTAVSQSPPARNYSYSYSNSRSSTAMAFEKRYQFDTKEDLRN